MSHAKISRKLAVALLASAAFFDLISLVPGLNIASAVIGQIVMAALFRMGGVNVFKGKQAITYALATLVEIFPEASFLPFFLIETAAIISLSWAKRV